jgi:DNA-binding response OmpR family regulator
MLLNAKAILLVEDEQKDAQLVRLAFRKANVRRPVVVARDGQEAMVYLRGFGKYRDRTRYPNPCLIIVDLTLPGMNGVQLLGWLKGQPEFEQVPRVVLTGSSQERDRKLAMELGCRDYFVKPPELDKLVEIISVIAGCGSRSTARRFVLEGQVLEAA